MASLTRVQRQRCPRGHNAEHTKRFRTRACRRNPGHELRADHDDDLAQLALVDADVAIAVVSHSGCPSWPPSRSPIGSGAGRTKAAEALFDLRKPAPFEIEYRCVLRSRSGLFEPVDEVSSPRRPALVPAHAATVQRGPPLKLTTVPGSQAAYSFRTHRDDMLTWLARADGSCGAEVGAVERTVPGSSYGNARAQSTVGPHGPVTFRDLYLRQDVLAPASR
jgi:hypothetical protein